MPCRDEGRLVGEGPRGRAGCSGGFVKLVSQIMCAAAASSFVMIPYSRLGLSSHWLERAEAKWSLC